MKKKRNLVLSLGVTVLLAACSNGKDSSNTDQNNGGKDSTSIETSSEVEVQEQTKTGYQIGDIATDFSLENINGEMVSLESMENAKGYIVVFTCNHCPYAVAYEDRIIALDKKYKELGYPVVAINPNDPEEVEDDNMENMKIRAEKKGFTFPYLMDAGQKIYPQYGATKTPHVFILQKTDQGNIVKYIGTIDDNYEDAEAVEKKYVEDAVDALIAGETIVTNTTKAIGCSIKTKKS